jgi:RNA recognition motif-containing protein
MSNLSDASRLKATVFVGGLDQAVTQQTLYHAFLPFGDIVEVNLPKPDLPGAKEDHRGFGYVEFETAADANDAIDNMDRSELYGQVIKVAAAKPQKDANEGLGSKTAVWEQVRIFTNSSSAVRLMPFRRAGWPSMLLAKRIDKQLSRCKKSQMDLWTRCKD